MVELSQVQANDKVADLGSGDGRISIAFAKKGAIVTGYELDLKLVQKSDRLIREAGVQGKVKILNVDFWKADLSGYDIVGIYPMPDIMEPLEQKLKAELHPGARVLTNYYPFPSNKPLELKNWIYLYKFI